MSAAWSSLSFKRFSREHDESVLDWIAMMDAGETIRSIAKTYGVSPGSVSRSVSAVRSEMEK